MQIGYCVAVVLLLLCACFCKFVLVGYSFLALILFLSAVAVSLYWHLSDKKSKLACRTRKILTVCVSFVILMMLIAEIPVISYSAKREKADSDYCIVLGAAVHGNIPSRVLNERINAAFDFLTEYPETTAILSGGQGKGEDISEAECMFKVLVSKGISPERLILESKSTSTEENIRFSKELFSADSATIITSETHLYRACLIARSQGLNASPYYSHTETPVAISQYLPESVAVWYEWIM